MKKDSRLTRRTFMQGLVGGAAAAGIGAKLHAAQAVAEFLKSPSGMPKRPLGKTGYEVCLFSLGGQATLEEQGKEESGIAIVNRAIDLGINYVDTAAAYGRGLSETTIGKVMKSRRKEVFLASKTHDRTYDGSMKLLEKSLKQLQTDHLDLWQLHNVRTREDLEKIFGSDGAIKALEKARSEHMVRFLGITGHRDPFILKEGIERYNFDTILMALNAADKHQASFIDNLLPTAVAKSMGIIGMKVYFRGMASRIPGFKGMEPFFRFALSHPITTAVIGCDDTRQLEENVRIASGFLPMADEERNAFVRSISPYARQLMYYKP